MQLKPKTAIDRKRMARFMRTSGGSFQAQGAGAPGSRLYPIPSRAPVQVTRFASLRGDAGSGYTILHPHAAVAHPPGPPTLGGLAMSRLLAALIPFLLMVGLVSTRAAEPAAPAKDAETWWSLKPI